MQRFKLLVSMLTTVLCACGGGGGGGGGSSGPVTSTNTFDVKSGWVRLIANGFTKNLTISGTCTGTYSTTNTPATTGTTFEGTAALSSTSVDTMTLTNCTPASTVNTETDYYDSNYMPVGYSVLGDEYAVWTTMATLPTAAKVGDASVIGSANIYSNNTKSIRTGKQDATLVIEADTSTTAIANIVLKYYTAADVLKQTQQRRFRVAPDGSLTLISIDVQFANGSTTHLVMN